MAIDKDALIKALFQDAGAVAAENLIPPTMWSWNKDVKTDTYDPDEAKAMLESRRQWRDQIDLWAMPDQFASVHARTSQDRRCR